MISSTYFITISIVVFISYILILKWRLKCAENKLNQIKEKDVDKTIDDSVHALSDDDLDAKLSKDFSFPPIPKS